MSDEIEVLESPDHISEAERLASRSYSQPRIVGDIYEFNPYDHLHISVEEDRLVFDAPAIFRWGRSYIQVAKGYSIPYSAPSDYGEHTDYIYLVAKADPSNHILVALGYDRDQNAGQADRKLDAFEESLNHIVSGYIFQVNWEAKRPFVNLEHCRVYSTASYNVSDEFSDGAQADDWDISVTGSIVDGQVMATIRATYQGEDNWIANPWDRQHILTVPEWLRPTLQDLNFPGMCSPDQRMFIQYDDGKLFVRTHNAGEFVPEDTWITSVVSWKTYRS